MLSEGVLVIWTSQWSIWFGVLVVKELKPRKRAEQTCNGSSSVACFQILVLMSWKSPAKYLSHSLLKRTSNSYSTVHKLLKTKEKTAHPHCWAQKQIQGEQWCLKHAIRTHLSSWYKSEGHDFPGNEPIIPRIRFGKIEHHTDSLKTTPRCFVICST